MLPTSVAPPSLRYLESPGRLEILIERRRGVKPAVFLSVWVFGWAFAAWSSATTLAGGQWSIGSLFLALWLVGWTVAGLTVVVLVLVLLVGEETVVVERGLLRLGVLVGPFRWDRAFDLSGILDLRALPAEPAATPRGQRSRRLSGGLAFEQGGRTIRFGAGLVGSEANRVLAAIRERLPSGRPPSARASRSGPERPVPFTGR